MKRIHCLLIAALALFPCISLAGANSGHALAMHGQPKYPAGFQHFDYVNPKAPKGGLLKLGVQGNFDSLNPFIAKGNAASETGLIYDTLTTGSADEPFTQYGLVAKTIEWPDDRSWVKYTLRPEARFHDGKPMTARDVEFTFHLLMKEGSPVYKTLYADVTRVEVLSEREIRFVFSSGENRELVLITGQLPVLPKHYWTGKDFSKTTLTPPLGSGPYRIESVSAGKSITLERVKNYWAADLPVNRGRFNFDRVQYDYYRDSTVLLEALKAGEYDLRKENVSRLWATGYTGDAITNGWLKTENIRHENPVGIQAFVFNLRKPLFQDIRVRKALNLAFDFEWTNNTLFYGAYRRSNSFFSNSELASSGVPGKEELALLEPLRSQLPPSVFTEPFALPVTKGDGNNREQLRLAKQLLEDAGWSVKDNRLVNARGEVFTFEFLVYDPSFERIVNPYVKALQRLGIQATIRKVEISQYINQLRTFDFDLITDSIGQSLSPGTEQIQYWHSSTAGIQAGRNMAGIRNPAIDALVMQVVQANGRKELVTATRALDRALLHNWYVIPQWYIDSHRIAYWDKFSRPAIAAKYDQDFDANLFTWWIDEKKLRALPSSKKQ